MLRRLILVVRHSWWLWRVLSNPKNVVKGGWDYIPLPVLVQALEGEVAELKSAAWGYIHGEKTSEQVRLEAGDVSAYAAMVGDRCYPK